MLMVRSGEWCLFLLAAIIPGIHLQRKDIPVQPVSTSGAQIYRPVLQPSQSIPPIGTYIQKNHAGKICIKATMGAEYIVIENKKTWYFSMDPHRIRTSGYCDKEVAALSLTLPDNSASVEIIFRKEKDVFYITKLTAHLSPLPICQRCANKTYSGLLDHEKLFKTANGQSFKCKSENVLLMSSELRIKLVPLEIQAFTLPRGHNGQEVECWADFNKRVVQIATGATVVGLFLIVVLSFLFIKDRRRQNYNRL